jgi:non-heme chloroperoxidase
MLGFETPEGWRLGRPDRSAMTTITAGTEDGPDVDLYVEDHGVGQPVVLIHGYLLDCRSWERQVPVLVDAGYRVVAYDRRGFGRSDQPSTGYDADSLAADLRAVIEDLDLSGIVLVGFSLGTAEIARYLATYSSERVDKAALIASVPPFLPRTEDNPDGVPERVFDEMRAAVAADRYAFLEAFLNDVYNIDVLGGTRVSDPAWQARFLGACGSSPFASRACIDTALTDFRSDLSKFDIPALAVHGTADRILPFASTAGRLPALVDDLTLIPVEDGPHDITWTHPDEVHEALLAFLRS